MHDAGKRSGCKTLSMKFQHHLFRKRENSNEKIVPAHYLDHEDLGRLRLPRRKRAQRKRFRALGAAAGLGAWGSLQPRPGRRGAAVGGRQPGEPPRPPRSCGGRALTPSPCHLGQPLALHFRLRPTVTACVLLALILPVQAKGMLSVARNSGS